MKFITWAKGFFEDQAGGASSKRAILYWAMSLVTYITIKDVTGAKVSTEIYMGAIGLVLAGLGLVTSEFFKKAQNTISKE